VAASPRGHGGWGRALVAAGAWVAIAVALADCTRPPPPQHERVQLMSPPAPVVAAQPVIRQYGKASFYGPEFVGKKTASGKKLVPSAMTAASKTLPLGTVVQVTNVENGKSARVVITDRGPYKQGRIIDLTPKAAAKLGMVKAGVASVKVEAAAKPQPPAEEVSSK
jgi:rare lipoprotein A